ncbi:MAG: hypothetical protein IKL18_00075 [Oscillospiraceae bacterium]|nr:hypothetical protein [Oscillospiraceae bacterium]
MLKNEYKIAKKLHEIRELQSLIYEAQEEIEDLKTYIKKEMGEAEELRAGEYRVTYKAVTSSRLDTTALKEALPEVFARFSKQTTARRFVLV